MKPILFDAISDSPLLGRLRGAVGRYRLRQPRRGNERGNEVPVGRFDVREPAALTGAGFVTNEEGMCVVTDAGRASLAALVGDASFVAAGAGLWVVLPDDVVAPTLAASGRGARYSASGYKLLSAPSLAVADVALPVTVVRGTSLYAVAPTVIEALRAAGLSPPAAFDAEHGFTARLPRVAYSLVRSERTPKGATFDHFECKAGSARLPAENPLARYIRHSDGRDGLDDGVDPFWQKLAAERVVHRAYSCGVQMPAGLTLRMERPLSDKRLVDCLHTSYLILSARARQVFEAAGARVEWLPVAVLDHGGKPVKGPPYHLAVPLEVKAWLDWEASDVNWTRSHSIWGLHDLVLTAAAERDEAPLVRLEHTRLHLVSTALHARIQKEELAGFCFADAGEYARALNSDDDWPDYSSI